MSEFTEVRDKAREDVKEAWKGAEPTTRAFFSGVGIGILIVFAAFLLWRLS